MINMKRAILGAALLVLPLLLAACGTTTDTGSSGSTPTAGTTVTGSGNVTTQTRDVKDYAAITLMAPGTLILQQGDAYSFSIEAEDNLLPYIETIMESNALDIKVKEGTSIAPTKPIKYTVTAKIINGVTLEGSGDLQAGPIAATLGATVPARGQLAITLAGSGGATIDKVFMENFVGAIAGSGDIKVNGGAATNVRVQSKGSGNFDSSAMPAKTGEISVSGSGEVLVRVSDSLTASTTGSGSIKYIGNPTVEKHVSGSGSVTQVSP